MADSVFGGGVKAPAAEGGVFSEATKPATNGGVFSGGASSAPVAKAAAPATSVNAPAVDTAFGASAPKEKRPLPWKRILKIGVPILAGLAIVGGALAAVLVYNSDDKIIGDAMANLFKDNDAKVDGELTASNLNSDGDKLSVKFAITARTDEAGKNSDLGVEVKVRPTVASVEALDGSKEFSSTVNVAYVNESIFAKIDYLQVLEQVMSAMAPDSEPIEWPEEATKYNNRWLMVSNETLTQFIDSENEDLQACLQKQGNDLRGNKKAARELYKILTTVVKFERESKKSGVATYAVEPSSELADYYAFLTSVRDSKIVANAVECGNNYQDGFADDFKEMLDEAIKAYDEMTDSERENAEKSLQDMLKVFPEITMQISTKTRRFVGLEIKGSVEDANLELKLAIESKHAKNIVVEAPSDVLELTASDLNGLQNIDLGSLLNSGKTAAQRAEVDRVVAQIAAYKTANSDALPKLVLGSSGKVEATDAFFAEYLNKDGVWDTTFTLRLLNDDDSTEFPNSYSAMTNSGPFYLREYNDGEYNAIEYSRYGDTNGDVWLIYGAECDAESENDTVKRAAGSNAAAVLTHLGNSEYYCAS